MDVAVRRLLGLILILFCAVGVCKKSGSRFTNLQCESYDLDFATFNKCKLKLISRGVVGIYIRINLMKIPIDNIYVNWSMWRRYSGYKPWLFNISCDLCQLLAHPYSPTFQALVLGAIKLSSNLNHTCPVNHDIIIDNLVFKDEYLKTLPVPQGDYKLQLRFATNKIWKFQIDVFLLRDE